MANPFRGEIEAEIGGERRTLCLTLGALAELENAFGATDLVALAERFQSGRMSAHDILVIIACGLRGGGAKVSDAEVASMRTPDGLSGFVAIAARLVAAAFGETPQDGARRDESQTDEASRPSSPQDV
jgi:hypothetical protein